MDFLLPENGHIDPDDGDYQSKDLVADKMIHHEPLLICNYELEVLSHQRHFDRIFSDHKFENVVDPRYCNVSICNQDLRTEKFCNQEKKESAPDFNNEFIPKEQYGCTNENNSPFTSGKGDPRLYFNVIDTESRLKNLGYSDNLCYVKDYRPGAEAPCADRDVFDKDYRTPKRINGRLECANLEIPDQCDKTKLYYYPQDFMRADQLKDKMFNNNTRRKTINNW
jgi:hypothetical protein